VNLPPRVVRLAVFDLSASAGWGSSAQILRDAADALFRFHYQALWRLAIEQDVDLQTRNLSGARRVILMLAGLSIENLAKGLWIQQNAGRFPMMRGRLPSELKGHERTVELLRDAKVPITTRERAFVRKLQAFVVWEGRYPVPMRVERLTEDVFQRDEFERFTELFDRLKALLDERWKEAAVAAARRLPKSH